VENRKSMASCDCAAARSREVQTFADMLPVIARLRAPPASA